MKKIFKGFVPAFLLTLILTQSIVFGAVDVYTVQTGDSLWKIAVKYQVGLSEIIAANPQFKNPHLIYPGDKVNVPLVDKATLSIEEQVVTLVNKERSKAGLSPLKINWQVSRVARIKSEDMRDNKYFNHISPVYGSPFEMLKKFNVTYKSAGENIAKGQRTAQDVMNSWMASEGHRKNILNAGFTEIGVGYCSNNSSTHWTQIFIS